MVTNSAGLVLYDTRQGSNAVGEYALYSVVAVALRGQDASYCSYDGTAFLSRVATPVVYHNQIVGAVYAYDYDTEQSELLEAFRHNLLIISLLIALLVAGLSIVLSQMLTRQISGLCRPSARCVRARTATGLTPAAPTRSPRSRRNSTA